MLLPGDGLVCDYFQIDSPSGNSYHSPSMAGRSFSLDPRVFAPDRLVDWVFDDTTLSPDTRVRRVVLKTSGVDMVWGGGGPRSAPPGSRPPRSGLTIYVHCAAETGKRDAALAGLAQRRDEELAAVDSQTNDSLGSLAQPAAGHQPDRVRRHGPGQFLAGAPGFVALAPPVRRRQPRLREGLPSAAGRTASAAGIAAHRGTTAAPRSSCSSAPSRARSRRPPTCRTSCARRWPPC